METVWTAHFLGTGKRVIIIIIIIMDCAFDLLKSVRCHGKVTCCIAADRARPGTGLAWPKTDYGTCPSACRFSQKQSAGG